MRRTQTFLTAKQGEGENRRLDIQARSGIDIEFQLAFALEDAQLTRARLTGSVRCVKLHERTPNCK